MRVIGGEARGRQVYLPKGTRIRPTSDSIKETLFNILCPLEDKTFLDLFAGSGNIGIEAMSRGAARVVFVEKSITMAKVIRKNVENLGFRQRCEILKMGAGRAIDDLASRQEKFDVLFADPPYNMGLISKILANLQDGKLFAGRYTLIVQHSVRENLQEALAGRYILEDERRCGDTALSFLKRTADK